MKVLYCVYAIMFYISNAKYESAIFDAQWCDKFMSA